MNWEKLKTFLIVLFSIINIFLITMKIATSSENVSIPRSTISDTVSVLSKNNIKINESVIPDKVKNMDDITLKPVTMVDGFLPNDAYIDSMSFEFDSGTVISTQQELKKLLSSCKFKKYRVLKGFSHKSAKIVQLIKGYPIFDAELDIECKKDKTKISGAWFKAQTYPKKSLDSVSSATITGILIDFINNPARGEGEQTIKTIDYGYTVSKPENDNVLYTAVPCWKIELDNGEKFFYNARNGEYIES